MPQKEQGESPSEANARLLKEGKNLSRAASLAGTEPGSPMRRAQVANLLENVSKKVRESKQTAEQSRAERKGREDKTWGPKQHKKVRSSLYTRI